MKQCLSAKLTALLRQVPIVGHLSRQKFVAQFVVGLIKSRNVQFCEVAQHLNDAVKPASNKTRIQDFSRETELNYLLLAHLLPATGKLRLCLDRTEWDSGKCQVNMLLVTVGRGELQLPLYWELLDNRSGNSSAADRIALLQLCVQVLGKHRIGLVLGDREFVGQQWLKDNGLNFVMRLPKHHQLTHPNGTCQAVADLGLAPGQMRRFGQCQVDGVWGQAYIESIKKCGAVELSLYRQEFYWRWPRAKRLRLPHTFRCSPVSRFAPCATGSCGQRRLSRQAERPLDEGALPPTLTRMNSACGNSHQCLRNETD